MRNKLTTVTVMFIMAGVILPLFANGSQESGAAPVNLTWYQIGNPHGEEDTVFEEVNKYTEEQLNINIKRNVVGWGDYKTKLTTMVASGQPMDIVFTASWMNYRTWATSGGLVPLNGLLDSHGQGIRDALPPAFIEGNKINGELYGIACNKEMAHQWAFILNKELVDKYGFDVPEIVTLDAMAAMFEVVKKNEPGIDVIAIPGRYSYDRILETEFDMGTVIVRKNDDSHRVVDLWSTPEKRDFLDTMREWYLAGYFNPEVATIEDANLKAGNFFAGITSSTPYAEITQSRDFNFEVIHAYLTEPIVTTGDIGGSMQGISSTSENPEKAMEFLNAFNTDVYLRNLIQFGIEGVHYKKLEENTITTEGMSAFNPCGAWSLGNMLITYLFENDPADKWEAYEEFNRSARISSILGFQFDPSPVANEVAAVNNVVQEYQNILNSGSVDIDEYLPAFLEKKRAAGGDLILAEQQKQLDAWVRANR